MDSSERELERSAPKAGAVNFARSARFLYATFQRELRANELVQIFACAFIGSGVGVAVAVLRALVQFLHEVDFGMMGGVLLSAGLNTDRAPTIVAGMIVLGEAMRAFELEQIEVSEHDILYGGALRLAGVG